MECYKPHQGHHLLTSRSNYLSLVILYKIQEIYLGWHCQVTFISG